MDELSAYRNAAVDFLKGEYVGFTPWGGQRERENYANRPNEELMRGVFIGRPGYQSLDRGADPLSSFSSCLLELKGRIGKGEVDEASIQAVVYHLLSKISPHDASTRVLESIADFFVSVNAGGDERGVRTFLQAVIGPNSQDFVRARINAAVALAVRGDYSGLEVLQKASYLKLPVMNGTQEDNRHFPRNEIFLARAIAGDTQPDVEGHFVNILRSIVEVNALAVIGLLVLGEGESGIMFPVSHPFRAKTIERMALESHNVPEGIKALVRTNMSRRTSGGGALNADHLGTADFMSRRAIRAIEQSMLGKPAIGRGIHQHNRNPGRTTA